MGRIGTIVWSAVFSIPLIVMIALDGFCGGGELCHAGLTFTLLIYAIGVAIFLISVLIARLMLGALNASPAARVRTVKLLTLIPLIPPLVVIGLLFMGLAGRLG